MRATVGTAIGFLAAAVLASSAFGGLAVSPVPGELWSRFPLEPSVEQTPGVPRPVLRATPEGPSAVAPRPLSPRPTDGDPVVPTEWILLGLGAMAAAAAAALASRRRRIDDSAAATGFDTVVPPGWYLGSAVPDRISDDQQPPVRQQVRVRTRAAQGSVSLAPRPPRAAPPAADPSLIEVLSPRLGAEQRVATDSEEQPEPESCEIEWWSGYLKGFFYVEADRRFESRMFRARGGHRPERTVAAVAAHDALVGELAAAGWERDGCGADWYAERFRR